MENTPVTLSVASTLPNQRRFETCEDCARIRELLLQLQARFDEFVHSVRPVVDHGADPVAVDPVTAEPLTELTSVRAP